MVAARAKAPALAVRSSAQRARDARGKGNGDRRSRLPPPNRRRLPGARPRPASIGEFRAADTDDVAGEAVRIRAHHGYRIGPVGLVDTHRPRSTHAVALQERHDVANNSLVGPACRDTLRALATDTLHLK